MRTTWLCTCTFTESGILVGSGHRCSCRCARRPRRQRPSRPGRSPPTKPASRATRGPAASVRSATPAPPRPTAGPAGCAPRAPTPATGVPRSASSAPVQSPARRSRTMRATSAGCRCQTAAAPAAVRLSSFAPCIWRNHSCLSYSALLDAQLKASFSWWVHHIMGPPRHCCLLQLGVCSCKSFLLSCVNMPQTLPVQAACPGKFSSSEAGQLDATAVKAEGKVLARVPAAPRNHFLPEAAQPCLTIGGAYRMTTVLLQPAGAFSPRKVGPWMTRFWPVGPAVNGPFNATFVCMSSRWQGAVHHIRASVVEATRAAEPAHAAGCCC